MPIALPERIVCLTEEPTEVLRQGGCTPGLGRCTRSARRRTHEIKSPLILQPGPAALTDGLDALHGIISRWSTKTSAHP